MKEGKVYHKILNEFCASKGAVFSVIDPPNQDPDVSGKLAKAAEEAGVSAVAVGGSVGAQGDLLDKTIIEIKENSSLPVILFPGNIATISKYADAIYFMSLMNSNDPYYITGAQIASAYSVKKLGLEVLPTSYIITEPGRAVGWVGKAQLIPRNLPYLAGITALAGQFMGSKLIILESGGGAPSPAPPAMVAYTKKAVDIPLIVAGGVRSPKHAFETIKAGADIIHVGTAAEEAKGNISKAKLTLTKMVQAVKKAAKTKK
ncbi:MAG: geranylgeranylglyceryl/heptaprenylglyceryl phosphate synthase [Candidatus Diapherotrites archaeon]